MRIKHVKKKPNINESILETKLYGVLRELSVYEINRLKKFVSSPYFNRNESLVRMLNVIDTAMREDSSASLSKSVVWQFSTQTEQYSDLKFRKLCSDLLKLIERFLIQEQFEKNDLQKAEYLLEAVHTKGLKILEKNSVKTAERLSDRYPYRAASYYYHEYAFERNYYTLTGYELDRSRVSNVQAIAENLDRFYFAEKLRYFCTVISRSRMGTHDYHLLFMDEIISQIESGTYADFVPINFYFQIYLTYKHPEKEEYYFKLKLIIAKHIRLLPEQEAKEIMDAAYNYCIWKINRGNQSYTREIFELYKESVQNELIYVNGILDPWNFRNIIVSGLRLGEYDWVKAFIASFKDKIDERYRSNAVSFNMANLYFYQKKYTDVLDLLQTVEYEDPSYNLNSKIMLILTFYEIDEIESLGSLLSSFEVYLRRRKEIPAERRQHYLNLIKYIRALMRIPQSDTTALEKLKRKILATEGVVNKAWLLEKIDALL